MPNPGGPRPPQASLGTKFGIDVAGNVARNLVDREEQLQIRWLEMSVLRWLPLLLEQKRLLLRRQRTRWCSRYLAWYPPSSATPRRTSPLPSCLGDFYKFC
ncbi:hypothetical protein SLEP1_g25277 [Rubroshorea leprosula]|uniref:Uncharacterized protein n=1 Tax=Rubroshorea leprosula TaxID=152421 RepID=A0AAV5JLF2_9ROSI|nr:hypothetical protein SLEP1_g25277 [Rubroshorea leprosula]